MSWKRARGKDLPALFSFLFKHEWRAVSFTSRLKRENRLVLPGRLDAWVFLSYTHSGLQGAIMFTSRGLLLPVLDYNTNSSLPISNTDPVPPNLKKIGFSLHSVMGLSRDVNWIEKYIPAEPEVSINYHLMTLNRERYSKVKNKPIHRIPGLELRPASLKDTERLFSLQKNYEIEEVMVSEDHFDERACFINLKHSILHQVVIMAEINGRTVAKAGTNARGFHVDQIGGVYTIESERNRGIGFCIMRDLLDQLFLKKEKVSLFVKLENLAAVSLYRSLGFNLSGRYRISYYRI